MIESKESFYKFGLLMNNDSDILFSNNCYHTSVYLAGYVLESYIKILLMVNGSTSRTGNNGYGGHVNSGNFVTRLMSIAPNEFNNSILFPTNSKYPSKLLNGSSANPSECQWDINHRYDVDRWTDSSFSLDIKNETSIIRQELVKMKLDGVI